MRLFALMFIPLYLFAIEAKVSLELNPNQELFISKKFTLTLKVMSTGYKLDDLDVDFNSNKDFLVFKPDRASYNDYEDDYSIVAYEYTLYPLRSGNIVLEPWSVSFSSSLGYGMESKSFTIETKSLKFNVLGVENYDFILATPNLELKTLFDIQKNDLEVGDAITRKITFKAKDVPDILIPAVKKQSFEGINVYHEEPKLKEEQNGSDLLSTRVEIDNFVFTQPGEYTIKSIEFPWYDTDTGEVKIERVEELQINVTAPLKPNSTLVENDAVDLKPFYIFIYFVIGVLLSSFVFYYIYKLFQAQHLKKASLPLSPKDELKRIVLACKNQHLYSVYDGFYSYAKSLGISTPSLKALKVYHVELESTLTQLEKALYSGDFDYTECQKEVELLLEKNINVKNKSSLLTSLNPS